MTLDKYFLERDDSVLLIVDIQDKLAAVMKEKDKVVKNNLILIEVSKMLKIPVVVTEQYPKGLGRTVPEIRAVLSEYRPVEKMTFNCCSAAAFLLEIKKTNRKKIIITGMETHICVLQTATGLLRDGFIPHVVQDAVCSRTKENWKTGTEFMRDAGAAVTCTETVLFQLLGVAGTEEFRAVSRMIK
ncbi:MAG TPA: hydrolase [Nitrospirota bacterium]|nr:hydrolase [Nitrospirota bacterium]